MSKETDNTTVKGVILAGAISLLSVFVVLFIDGFFPFGNGSVAALDLHSQYIPILYRFYDTVTGVKNISMDFHIGGGLNMYSDTLTELLNPFNYILLLFGRANIYKAVSVLLSVYVCAASMSASFALSKLFPGNRNTLNILFSISYGMSYFVAYQYEIIRWLYIVVLFPLFVLALMRMLKEEKPFLFIIGLGYILTISLQFGIQLCFFSFVYISCFLYKESNRKIKEIDGKKCLMAGLSLICAVLLSAAGTVPAVMNLMGSARSVQNDSVLSVITHHGLDNILERILEVSSPVVIGGIIAALFVLKKQTLTVLKEHLEVTACLGIILLTVILEPSNLLWHLGSYQCFPVRYGYIVVWLGLMLVSVLCEACGEKALKEDDLKNGKMSQGWKAVVSCLAVMAAVAVTGFVYLKRLMFAQAFATLDISNVCKKETLLLYACLFILSVGIFVVLVCTKKRNNIADVCLLLVGALAGITIFMAVLWPRSSPARIANETAYEQMNESAVVSDCEEYSGHIADNSNFPLNAALVNGEYSMSAYVPSGEGLEYVKAMNKLGYDTPWVSVTCSGGNVMGDRFLGVDGEFVGAIGVTDEEYANINTVADIVELQKDKEPLPFTFDNRKGQIRIIPNRDAKVVLLPMAYIQGWHSSQGEIKSYLGGFLAIDLTQETQEIVLTYSTPGLTVGIVLAVIGLVILTAMIFWENKENILCSIASKFYLLVAVAFLVIVYVLPNLGMLIFMGAKAVGYDLTPYLESSKNTDENVHILLSESMEEDGLHVLIGCNNLMNDKGVKIKASDEESSQFRASKATDGIYEDSRWSSENNWDDNNHFLMADFGEGRTVKAVKIYWERTNATNYTIETSKDGENWNVVSSFEEPSVQNPQIIYYESGLDCRFLRLHVTDVLKNEEDGTMYYQNVSVKEFEVYDDKCDSFVINTPQLAEGYDRTIPTPEVPDGYHLKVGGINYDNLKVKDNFADTIAPVDINLGYVLSIDGESWDLPGFDVTLPASDGNDTTADAFPYKDISVREWAPLEGTFQPDDISKDAESLECLKEIIDSENASYLGEEGYEINISSEGITLIAADSRGICWGRVTLKHMLEQSSKLPCGTLRDYPEYAVRGFVLDVARRPISMDFLYRVVDTLSDNYMNTLQLHFNDNAIISESEYDNTVDGARKLYSSFKLESDVSSELGRLSADDCYSDEELLKLFEYAESKGVEIVPEIDTPAHSMAITKLYPELSYNDYPELADTLDVSKPEAVDFAKSLWSFYIDGEDALFGGCDTLHLGMDEFFGDNRAYARYLSDMCTFVKDTVPDKTIRVWASMDYNEVDNSTLPKDIQMMVWSPIWADPMKTYSDGFGVINCLNKNLYIIVDGGMDRIDMDNLQNNWEPNVFRDDGVDETIPAWSQRMLGACYCMWNDNYCKEGKGPSEDALYDRFEEPIYILADKLWNH